MNFKYKGISIHYSETGEGMAVVLLHGFLENSTMWDAFIFELSKKNKVICIDLLGHGQTGCLGYIHTMEMMANAVDAILNHLKIKSATFIGHSMGGYVALAYAQNFPKKINGLCLMNSTAKADDDDRKKNRDRAIIAVKQNYKFFVSIAVVNLFRPKNRKIFSEQLKSIKKEALKTPVQGIIAALEGMKIREDRELIFRNGPFKKLMIISKKDPVLNYNSLIQQTTNSNIKVLEFPDGHMSHVENESLFLRTIMHFIDF